VIDTWEQTNIELESLYNEIKRVQWDDPKSEDVTLQTYLAKYLRKECINVHQRRITLNMASISKKERQ
jgi:hypothetical protein